jgi:hypothetical protein
LGRPGVKDCVKTLESAITDLKSGLDHLKKLDCALQAVCGAAKSTCSKLNDLAKKRTGDDKQKYENASSASAGIGAQAAAMQKKIG